MDSNAYAQWLQQNAQDPYKVGSLFVNPDGTFDRAILNEYFTSAEGGTSERASQEAAVDYYTKAYQDYLASQQPASGGTGVASTYDPEQIAYYGDEIKRLERLLQSVDTTEGSGLTSINDSYGLTVDRTNQERNQGLAQFDTQLTDTQQDKLNAFGAVDDNSRNTWQGLQRLLGMGGAGVSSAAQVLAPYAVSRFATQQRTGLNQQYGRNFRDIDTGRGQFEQTIANRLADTEAEKKAQERDFLQGIYNQRLGLYGDLSNAVTQKQIASGETYSQTADDRQPYENQSSRLQNLLDGLFGKYGSGVSRGYAADKISAKTPDLAPYTYDRARVNAVAQNPNTDSSLLPYLSMLRKTDENVRI